MLDSNLITFRTPFCGVNRYFPRTETTTRVPSRPSSACPFSGDVYGSGSWQTNLSVPNLPALQASYVDGGLSTEAQGKSAFITKLNKTTGAGIWLKSFGQIVDAVGAHEANALLPSVLPGGLLAAVFSTNMVPFTGDGVTCSINCTAVSASTQFRDIVMVTLDPSTGVAQSTTRAFAHSQDVVDGGGYSGAIFDGATRDPWDNVFISGASIATTVLFNETENLIPDGTAGFYLLAKMNPSGVPIRAKHVLSTDGYPILAGTITLDHAVASDAHGNLIGTHTIFTGTGYVYNGTAISLTSTVMHPFVVIETGF